MFFPGASCRLILQMHPARNGQVWNDELGESVMLAWSKRLAASFFRALVADGAERSLHLDLDANRILRVIDQLQRFQATATVLIRYRDRGESIPQGHQRVLVPNQPANVLGKCLRIGDRF